MARDFLVALTRNKISLVGTALIVSSVVLILMLFIIQQLGFKGGPYLGIVTFLGLPMVLITGLILVPIGIHRHRILAARSVADGSISRFPVFDLNVEGTRRHFIIFLALTTFFIVLLASATYKGVHVMDSTEFCGLACHSVMQPEYTAHQRSPHARVRCADCHIGPGADWFVKSKISGAWQLVAVSLNIYPRPIPTPIHNLRPARETCEQCHWPTNHVGDALKIKTKFSDDETNTMLKTAVLLKVGGLAGRETSGIHWHVNPDVQVRYRSDESRQVIYDVELTRADGSVTLYKNGEAPAEASEWRVMDCVDCHNRPTHRYRLPDEEVDLAMAAGDIDPMLPFVKRESMRVLQETYESHDQAREAIPAALRSFYQEDYAEIAARQSAEIDRAAAELVEIYTSNVFPQMNVTWGLYPDHSGHQESPGCFRCHDRKHKSEDGESISRKCTTCHTILAEEEESPEILDVLNP